MAGEKGVGIETGGQRVGRGEEMELEEGEGAGGCGVRGGEGRGMGRDRTARLDGGGEGAGWGEAVWHQEESRGAEVRGVGLRISTTERKPVLQTGQSQGWAVSGVVRQEVKFEAG